jgi:hypothetical protein
MFKLVLAVEVAPVLSVMVSVNASAVCEVTGGPVNDA